MKAQHIRCYERTCKAKDLGLTEEGLSIHEAEIKKQWDQSYDRQKRIDFEALARKQLEKRRAEEDKEARSMKQERRKEEQGPAAGSECTCRIIRIAFAELETGIAASKLNQHKKCMFCRAEEAMKHNEKRNNKEEAKQSRLNPAISEAAAQQEQRKEKWGPAAGESTKDETKRPKPILKLFEEGIEHQPGPEDDADRTTEANSENEDWTILDREPEPETGNGQESSERSNDEPESPPTGAQNEDNGRSEQENNQDPNEGDPDRILAKNLPDGHTLIEIVNITAMGDNQELLKRRDAHYIFTQEHRTPDKDVDAVRGSFATDHWTLEAGPLIPGSKAPAGGVAGLARNPMPIVDMPPRTEAMKRLIKTGRVAKYIITAGEATDMIVFNIYGMTNGADCRKAALTTDCIIDAIKDEVSGPGHEVALIVGDLNAEPSDIPTLSEMLSNGWVDVGAEAGAVGGESNEPTCQANPHTQATRRDYVIASQCAWPLVAKFRVDNTAEFSTHSVLQLVIDSGQASQRITTVKQVGNLADLWSNHIEHSIKDKEPKEARDIEKELKRK